MLCKRVFLSLTFKNLNYLIQIYNDKNRKFYLQHEKIFFKSKSQLKHKT